MDTDDEPPRPAQVEYAYMIVANDIAARIERGELRYGDRLPVREDLAARYGVGEMTVRRAMRELADRGMVRPMSSRGTFVIWRGHIEGT